MDTGYINLREGLLDLSYDELVTIKVGAGLALETAAAYLAKSEFESRDFVSELQKRIKSMAVDVLAIDNALAMSANKLH